LLLRAAAGILEGPAAALRRRLAAFRSDVAWEERTPAASRLATVFETHGKRFGATSERDGAYLAWRYLDAPYRDELRFYLAGSQARPSLALVARQVEREQVTQVRVLDLFGDLGERRLTRR